MTNNTLPLDRKGEYNEIMNFFQVSEEKRWKILENIINAQIFDKHPQLNPLPWWKILLLLKVITQEQYNDFLNNCPQDYPSNTNLKDNSNINKQEEKEISTKSEVNYSQEQLPQQLVFISIQEFVDMLVWNSKSKERLLYNFSTWCRAKWALKTWQMKNGKIDKNLAFEYLVRLFNDRHRRASQEAKRAYAL